MKCDKITRLALSFKKFGLRKKNFLASLCLIAYLPAQADIVVRASTTSFTQYAAWIATHPEDSSWMNHLEKQYPSKLAVANLADLVESSQKSFLTGSLEDAKLKFKQIADLANSNDWHLAEREAITYAMLRFAQLDKTKLKSDYIKKAALFGYDCHFDPRFLPPPIIRQWKFEVALARKKAVRIANLKDFNGFDVMKVDGRSYPLNESDTESILIFPGEHRISLLGSQAQYFTQKITSSQLQVMKIEPVVIASGSCSEPKLEVDTHQAMTVLFDDACFRTHNGQNWLPGSSSRLSSKIDKLDLQSSAYKKSEQNFQTEIARDSQTHPHTWIWVGLGAAVLTSLALVYQNNQNQFSGGGSAQAVTPVHKQGN